MESVKEKKPVIAVVGTFDSKAEEHIFLKDRIEEKGLNSLTINMGTRSPSPVQVDLDLYEIVVKNNKAISGNRDKAIEAMITETKKRIKKLYRSGEISGMISAGGGTGTHLCTSVMHELPLGVPKVMISTVASRDMSQIVGIKDITMFHSVVDLLGVNSISGILLDQAVGAICGMVQSRWESQQKKKLIALTMFGFVTDAAEEIKKNLEDMGYEVIAFHANGTGGMAMEGLAREGYFHGILDLATHELADELIGGYCKGIGPDRLMPIADPNIPRLVVPGGLDCGVLEFTRDNIPSNLKDRKIFFYDFRSAIRLNDEESFILAGQLAEKLNQDPSNVKVIVPTEGWSEADQKGGPLYDPELSGRFILKLKEALNEKIEIREVAFHINEPSFAREASKIMDEMIRKEELGL